MLLDELKQTVYDTDDLVYKIKTKKALRDQQKGSFTTKVKNFLPNSFEMAVKEEIDEMVEFEPRVEKQELPERIPTWSSSYDYLKYFTLDLFPKLNCLHIEGCEDLESFLHPDGHCQSSHVSQLLANLKMS